MRPGGFRALPALVLAVVIITLGAAPPRRSSPARTGRSSSARSFRTTASRSIPMARTNIRSAPPAVPPAITGRRTAARCSATFGARMTFSPPLPTRMGPTSRFLTRTCHWISSACPGRPTAPGSCATARGWRTPPMRASTRCGPPTRATSCGSPPNLPRAPISATATLPTARVSCSRVTTPCSRRSPTAWGLSS